MPSKPFGSWMRIAFIEASLSHQGDVATPVRSLSSPMGIGAWPYPSDERHIAESTALCENFDSAEAMSSGSEVDGREIVPEHDLAGEVLRGERAPLFRRIGRHRRDVMREHERADPGSGGGARRVVDR